MRPKLEVKTAPKAESYLRQVRIERRSKAQIASEDMQSWAVSYSDMLMVLMSFFVIFFSFEDKKRDDLVSQISLEMQAKSGGGGLQDVTGKAGGRTGGAVGPGAGAGAMGNGGFVIARPDSDVPEPDGAHPPADPRKRNLPGQAD